MPWDLTSGKSGSPRYAFANHVTGQVSVCMRRCDTSGVLHDFNFADQNGNAIRIRLIRFHYQHLVVVGQNPAGVAHVFYQNVITNAREVLSSWGSPESTADVNGELVVFSRIPLAIPPAARYVFWYWRIGSPVATAQQVFPNSCANFDFRHPRLTATHLVFLLRWLNTRDKVEVEAYPLASLGTENQTACILSGDLIPWNRVHPWHEVWQAGRGPGAVSFYTLQTRGAPPGLQVTCWE